VQPANNPKSKEKDMMRTLKVAMALMAVSAMSLVGVAAAQATTSGLDVGVAPAILTGEQVTQNKLAVTSSTGTTLTTVKCSVAKLDATTTEKEVHEATLTPTYSTCEVGGLTATVNPNSCKYTLTDTLTALTANADVTECGTGKIEITQGTCVLTIGNTSTALEDITFSNVAGSSPKHVLATLNVKKIPVTGDSGCTANLQAAGLTGDLTGTQTVKAYEDISGAEGPQVSLEAT
jgi:hypothetical protein